MILLFILVGGFCAWSSGGCFVFALACHRGGNDVGFRRCLACSLVSLACAGVNAACVIVEKTK